MEIESAEVAGLAGGGGARVERARAASCPSATGPFAAIRAALTGGASSEDEEDTQYALAHASAARRGFEMGGAAGSPRPWERELPLPAAEPQAWSAEMEAAMRRAIRQADGYAWMYEQMVAGAKWWGNKLTISTKLLGGVLGTQGLIGALMAAFSSGCGSGVPIWVPILSAALGFVVLGLGVLDDTWSVDVVHAQGIVAQVNFATLARSIHFQLALPCAAREDARVFVPSALRELEGLKLTSPTIWGGVKARYVRRYPGNPIYNLAPEDALAGPATDWGRYDRPPLWEGEPAEGGGLLPLAPALWGRGGEKGGAAPGDLGEFWGGGSGGGDGAAPDYDLGAMLGAFDWRESGPASPADAAGAEREPTEP